MRSYKTLKKPVWLCFKKGAVIAVHRGGTTHDGSTDRRLWRNYAVPIGYGGNHVAEYCRVLKEMNDMRPAFGDRDMWRFVQWGDRSERSNRAEFRWLE